MKALTDAELVNAKKIAFSLAEQLSDQLFRKGMEPCMPTVVLILAAAYAEGGDIYGSQQALNNNEVTDEQRTRVQSQLDKIQDAKDHVPNVLAEIEGAGEGRH
jgi:hypothetical protein